MSQTATIGGNAVDIAQGSLQRPDKVGERGSCSFVVIDLTGAVLFQRGQPVVITDSILGTIFTGYVTQAGTATSLYPNPGLQWPIVCADQTYPLDVRTSQKSYGNQFAGTVVVDQVQRNASAEGIFCRAALRWDELETDWAAGTLSNTLATTNATDGNVGDGDLELALSGSNVAVTGVGAGFALTHGLKLTGYASAGYVNPYTYRQIWSGSHVINASDDLIIYDVWISSDSPAIVAGIDVLCSDGTTLRSTGQPDQQGMSCHPATDLSGLANDQWYTRNIGFPTSMNGKTIVSMMVALEGDTVGTYVAYFRNISYNHFSTGFVFNFFGPTDTLTTNAQALNNGYSNVALTQVNVENKSKVSVGTTLSIGAAGIVQSSYMSWPSLIPDGCTGMVETSIDNGASWQAITSGSAVPNLTPGMVVTGRSVLYRMTLTIAKDPTVLIGFGSPTLVVRSAYASAKTDVLATTSTATDFAAGILTDLKTLGSGTTAGITLNGIQRNWDTADTSNMTVWGTSGAFESVIKQQIQLSTNTGTDVRDQLVFAGSWQNFTSEVDVSLPAANVQCGLVYRTVAWQNTSDTYGYMVVIQTTAIVLGRGTNSATGAGAFTSIHSTPLALTTGSVHRLKLVVSDSMHQVYLDGVLLISATDTTYGPYSLGVLGNTPLAYYRMDEASGTVLHDSGTNAFNGTINTAGITYNQAGALTGSGDTDTALLFDGLAGFATMHTSVNPSTHTAVSVACWVKLSGAFTGIPRILANSHTDIDHKGFQMFLNASGTVSFQVGNGTVSVTVTSTSTLAVGTWAHVVGVCDGANMHIYFNGVQQASTTFTNAFVSNGFPIGIGYNPAYSGDFFPGTIDEVAVYLTGLSAAAVSAAYGNGTAIGELGLRLANASGATQSALFDNFGVCAALSGTWQSPSINIAGPGTYGNSLVQWDTDGLPDGTTSITAQTSIDAGATWQSVSNGGAISGLTVGGSLTGKTLLLKLTLTASNAPVVPTLNGVTMWVMGQYGSSGTRIAPTLALSAVGRAGTALVNWNAITPANTSLAVATSIDGGATYQTAASPGGAITDIAVQPAPVVDTFASNTSANYTQSNFGGVTGSWTWDTANSRLTGSGGTNGTIVNSTALTAADNQVMADFDQADGSGLITNYVDANDLYFVQIWDASGTGTQNAAKLFKRSGGTNTQLGGTATINFPRGTYLRFVLDVQAGVLTVSLDGVQLIQVTDGSPLGAGKSGLLLNTLVRCYSLRIQQYGEDVSALSLLTKLTLTSTDPTVTPQVLDMQAFVSSTDIGPGVLIPAVSYIDTFLSNNINDLSQKSNYWQSVRPDKSVIFQERDASPAPFVLSSLNSQIIGGQTINDVLLEGAGLSNNADLYRSRQIMQNAIATASFTEIKSGDGSTRTWNVAHALAAPPTAFTLNGQSVTFGIKGVDTGKQFYYQVGSMAIDQDSSQTLLAKADSFTIIYSGSFAQDVVRNNTGGFPGTISQAQMAAIATGTSGIVEAVEDASSMTTAMAIVAGDQRLQRYGTFGRTFQFKTLRSGLLAGQQLTLFVPEFGITDAQMLITEVDVALTNSPAVTGGLLYAWIVTATEGPALGSWVKLFASALG